MWNSAGFKLEISKVVPIIYYSLGLFCAPVCHLAITTRHKVVEN